MNSIWNQASFKKLLSVAIWFWRFICLLRLHLLWNRMKCALSLQHEGPFIHEYMKKLRRLSHSWCLGGIYPISFCQKSERIPDSSWDFDGIFQFFDFQVVRCARIYEHARNYNIHLEDPSLRIKPVQACDVFLYFQSHYSLRGIVQSAQAKCTLSKPL